MRYHYRRGDRGRALQVISATSCGRCWPQRARVPQVRCGPDLIHDVVREANRLERLIRLGKRLFALEHQAMLRAVLRIGLPVVLGPGVQHAIAAQQKCTPAKNVRLLA